MWKNVLAVALCGVFICLAPSRSAAQGTVTKDGLATLQQLEDSLVLSADSMYGAYIPDTRIVYSERFVRQLVRALKTPNSWSYPFEKLNQRINILYPEDKSFRIFNWAIAPTDLTRRYYGAVQLPAEQLKLYGLVDYSTKLGKGAEDSVLSGGKWMGALYYRIIGREVNGQTVYTLFGVNGANPMSNRKVLEPMTLTPGGPVFGAKIFGVRSETTPTERVNRFILEYKKDVSVAMNWDSNMNAIYFDKLVSQVNDPNRKYTYVPSGQIDGFKWAGNQWNYIQDLVQVVPRKDGEAPVGEPKE